MRLLPKLLLTLLLSVPALLFSQLSDRATVTLLTCGSGDELYSVFGHTAIRVADPASGVDTVYNFGTFDFSTPNFYLKFVKGDLQYFVSVGSYDDFVEEYRYFGRDVFAQQLNISTGQKQAIYDELNSILLSDRRFYTYKFIDRNCTTMVADIINKYAGLVSMQNSDAGKTNRTIIYSYLDNHFFENLGINLIFGHKTDKPQDKLFLPRQLMEGVSHTKNKNGNLSGPAIAVNKGGTANTSAPWWNSYVFFCAILLILAAVCYKYRVAALSYMTIVGLLGIFFCFVGFYSFHSEITQNYNALMINPLFLLLAIFILANKPKAVFYAGIIIAGMHMIYLLFMLNKPHLLIILPIFILNLILLYRYSLSVRTQRPPKK